MTSNVLKRPQMTSNEVTKEKVKSHKRESKISLKGGSVHKNIEINGEDSDEILHNNNLYMELAMQIFSKDQTVRNNTVQGLKDFDSQSLATQVKKNK